MSTLAASPEEMFAAAQPPRNRARSDTLAAMDALEASKKMTAAGIPRAHEDQIARATDAQIDRKAASRADLERAETRLENRITESEKTTIKWVAGTFIAVVAIVATFGIAILSVGITILSRLPAI